MKLLSSFGPNPRMVRMFCLEKGIDIEMVEHDLLGGENRAAAYTAKNPGGQMPALELDDGSVIGETVAVCEYLEEKNPSNPLIGSNAEERAETRMWVRRVELNITENMYNGFRYAEGIDIFRDRMLCFPESADSLKAKAKGAREWLDNLMTGRDFVGGDKITLADLVLFCCLDFMNGVGQPLEAELSNLSSWMERMKGRDSAAASLHPGAAETGMQG